MDETKELIDSINDSYEDLQKEIDDLPNILSSMDKKEKKRYMKKLKANLTTKRIKKLLSKKDTDDKTLRELERDIFVNNNFNIIIWSIIITAFCGSFFLMGITLIAKLHFALFIIGIMLWIISIILGVMYFFRSTNKIRLKIIQKNHKIGTKKVKLDVDKAEYKKEIYLVRSDGIYYEKGKPVSYYFSGNPEPIVFDVEKYEVLISPKELYSSFKKNIVQGLFSDGGLTRGQTITAGVILALILAGIVAYALIKGNGSEAMFMLFPLNRLRK